MTSIPRMPERGHLAVGRSNNNRADNEFSTPFSGGKAGFAKDYVLEAKAIGRSWHTNTHHTEKGTILLNVNSEDVDGEKNAYVRVQRPLNAPHTLSYIPEHPWNEASSMSDPETSSEYDDSGASVPSLMGDDTAIPQADVHSQIASTDVTAAAPHPWTEPPYNIVEREAPVIHNGRATFKITISLCVVASLIIGYAAKVRIVNVSDWSFGMYGLLLILDFSAQTAAATINRRRVSKVSKESPIGKIVRQVNERKIQGALDPTAGLNIPEVSIAVVGYREDEEAWIKCLQSLQAQEFPIKHIIGVIDGNEQPDLNMAESFGKAFPEDQRLIVHLPVLLSVMYTEKYWETINQMGCVPPTRWQFFKMWFTQAPREGQEAAHAVAWNYTLNYLAERAEAENWKKWKGICFSQPHGHKRHAMFTSFIVGAYALGTRDAILTTDSDTYVHPDAVTHLLSLLHSDSRLAGVTGDVRIWNKSDSFLALMSSLRYWFAFNVERACQSCFGCVGCLSGPLGLYRTSDLIGILGPWILQSFLGKDTTFGDDRHLTNRILSLGHHTGYNHLAICESDTPAGYVRWVKQQTRWSKSFFREAFWFPKSFAYQRFWLTVETTKQFMYPMILTATVLHLVYLPRSWVYPLLWLITLLGVACVKSLYGVICMRDPTYLLFGIYGFMYFFGLLPSKLFAAFTVGITTWGTSARSKSEVQRPESFYSRTTHVGHLAVWYTALAVGLAYFMSEAFQRRILWCISLACVPPIVHLYEDVILGESKYVLYLAKKRWRSRRRAGGKGVQAPDVEKALTVRPPSPPSQAGPSAPAKLMCWIGALFHRQRHEEPTFTPVPVRHSSKRKRDVERDLAAQTASSTAAGPSTPKRLAVWTRALFRRRRDEGETLTPAPERRSKCKCDMAMGLAAPPASPPVLAKSSAPKRLMDRFRALFCRRKEEGPLFTPAPMRHSAKRAAHEDGGSSFSPAPVRRKEERAVASVGDEVTGSSGGGGGLATSF